MMYNKFPIDFRFKNEYLFITANKEIIRPRWAFVLYGLPQYTNSFQITELGNFNYRRVRTAAYVLGWMCNPRSSFEVDWMSFGMSL